jgi:predicted dehydrogenase
MSGPLRVGLVGCGRLAEAGYMPAAADTQALEITAVADPSTERREAFAQAGGTVAFAGAAELIESGLVEAVVIASPPAEHLAQAALAAAAGLPCLVEKPPAADAAGAVALAALEPAPWIGFNRRFQQGAALLEEIPREGELELELELCYRRRSWNAHQVADEPLLDLAPHLVDLALLLAGPRIAVRAASSGPHRCALVLETSRGTAWVRCANDRRHLERAVARRPGRRALAKSNSGGMATAAIARLGRRRHPLVVSLRHQLEAFAAAARGGDPGLLADADQGARVMAVIDEARERANGTA